MLWKSPLKWMITGGSPIFGNHPNDLNVVNHEFEPFRQAWAWAWAMAPTKTCQEIKEIYGRGLSDPEQFEIWAGTTGDDSGPGR